MENKQFCFLNANIFGGISFLAEGFDRVAIVILAVLWLIGSFTTKD